MSGFLGAELREAKEGHIGVKGREYKITQGKL